MSTVKVFKQAEQIGRLYLLPSKHARGNTFRIYVLPAGEEVIENAGINPPLNKDAVEVYGITGGQAGWTETYGWLHEGKWQSDFEALYQERLEEAVELIVKRAAEKEKRDMQIQSILASYT